MRSQRHPHVVAAEQPDGRQEPRPPRGRRPDGDNDTRTAIAAAARQEFGELGYRRSSLRAIAARAGVDQRLVAHYFGSKRELFNAVVTLPFDPPVVLDRLFADGRPGVGRRLAEFLVSTWESPEGGPTLTGLLRTATSEDESAALIRDLVSHRLLGPLALRVGSDHPELRASPVASQVIGLIMARHIIGLEPLRSAPDGVLVDALAGPLDHYLTGDLTERTPR